MAAPAAKRTVSVVGRMTEKGRLRPVACPCAIALSGPRARHKARGQHHLRRLLPRFCLSVPSERLLERRKINARNEAPASLAVEPDEGSNPVNIRGSERMQLRSYHAYYVNCRWCRTHAFRSGLGLSGYQRL